MTPLEIIQKQMEIAYEAGRNAGRQVSKKVPIKNETPNEEKIVLAGDEDWGVDIKSDYSD